MSVILWEQHNVGDAGFRAEQRFATYYRDGGDGPKVYVPVISGTEPSDATEAVYSRFRKSGRAVFAEPADGFFFQWDGDKLRVLPKGDK